MKIDPGLKKFMEEAQQDVGVRVELAKMDFASTLEAQRRSAGVTYKQVADALKTSAAYVSKVFRGDSNLTIESMVKLAEATGGKLEVRVVPVAAEAVHAVAVRNVHWLSRRSFRVAPQLQVESSYTDALVCANHEHRSPVAA